MFEVNGPTTVPRLPTRSLEVLLCSSKRAGSFGLYIHRGRFILAI